MVSSTAPDQPADKVDLTTLLGLFYPTNPDELASFERVTSSALPATARQLLDHDSHMTITVEAFHHSSVNVRVLRSQESPAWYAREILLTRADNGDVVQYGIVRLRPDQFSPDTWREIHAGNLPLGRVLIEHDVFRQVERIGLWKVSAGPRLAELLRIEPKSTIYGRTARILCDGAPAIELLEIVASVA